MTDTLAQTNPGESAPNPGLDISPSSLSSSSSEPPRDHTPRLDDDEDSSPQYSTEEGYSSDDTFAEEFNVGFRPRDHNYETIDFRTPTSKANLARYFPRTARDEGQNYRALMTVALLIGLTVALAGFSIEQGVRGFTWIIYTVAHDILMEEKRELALGGLVFVVLACLYVAMASSMVVFVSPLAAGSGIPEIKSYLNGVRMPGLLRFRTLVAKAVGVTMSISGGLVCGKEGPMIHCGGIIGAGFSRLSSTPISKWPKLRWLNHFRTAAWKRDLTAIGAAAGVAVAFRAPLGGVLFVVEEAATHWSQPLTWAAVVAASVAAFLSGSLHSLSLEHFNIDLSHEGVFSGPGSEATHHITDVPFYLIIAVACGLLGGILTRVQRPLTLFRYRHVSTPRRRFLEAISVAAVTALLRVVISLSGRCQDTNQGLEDAFGDLGQFNRFRAEFNCGENQFNDVAALVFQPIEVANQLLLNVADAGEFRALVLIGALAFFFIILCWTYGIAVPSGVFIPAFTVGSLVGRLVGVAVSSFWARDDFRIETYAFVGAVAGLAGITRMTLSVAVIALETTSNGQAFLVALLVAWVAKFVGDAVDASIYDLHISLRGVPIIETRHDHHAEKYYALKVRDIMSARVIAVEVKVAVRDLVRLLKAHKHGSFPVVRTLPQGLEKANGDPQLARICSTRAQLGTRPMHYLEEHSSVPGIMDINTMTMRGMIDRGTLLELIRCLHALDEDKNESFLDLMDQSAVKREAQIIGDLTLDDLDRVIDLCPYTDPNPEMITEGATVAEAKTLMRESGARHAVVVHIRTGAIVGIVTRTDVLPEAVLDASAKRFNT